MRHLRDSSKLGRTTSHRKAMLRNMVTSLILHERIETTLAKAKQARRGAERMVTFGKQGTLHARRQAARFIQDPSAVAKLFDGLAERYKARQGGYTRIYKLGHRLGDAAPMAVLEYVDRPAKVLAPTEKKTLSKTDKPKTDKKEASAPKKQARLAEAPARQAKAPKAKIEKSAKVKAPAKAGLLNRIRGRSSKES